MRISSMSMVLAFVVSFLVAAVSFQETAQSQDLVGQSQSHALAWEHPGGLEGGPLARIAAIVAGKHSGSDQAETFARCRKKGRRCRRDSQCCSGDCYRGRCDDGGW